MSKKTLNQTNLEALGAERLAALLIEVSTGSADMKRRLRLELSHNLGPAELAHEVRKRLVSLRKSTSFVGWRKRKALIKDLATQVQMITQKIAPEDPATAFELLWQFVEMAPHIYGRVDDSKGDVGAVFETAFDHFAHIGPKAAPDPAVLAAQVWGAVQDNGHGEWDGIIAQMADTLGAGGLDLLRAHVETYAAGPAPEHDSQDHEAIRFLRQLRGGAEHAADRKAQFVKRCLQEIAAAAGDRQAYIAQYSETELMRSQVAAEVAGLLLEDAQPEMAMETLLNVDPQDGSQAAQTAWDDAYITTLTALDRSDEAQAHRWACFCDRLDPRYLRDHLKLLPDFDDVEAEDAAKRHVADFPSLQMALRFCFDWPDLLLAAQLIEQRSAEIDGNYGSALAPAAELLRGRYPLAAVLLWRAVIDYTLEGAVSHRYPQAVEFLNECASVDAEITDYRAVETHAAYVEKLRYRFARSTSFWDKISGLP